jgi:hypothetical protein
MYIIMSDQSRRRQYEGPAERYQEQGWGRTTERNLRDPRGMNGGKSPEAILKFKFGEKGKGWDVSAEAYADENNTQHLLDELSAKSTEEALANYQRFGQYMLNDGTAVSGLVEANPPEAEFVDVVIYPDGKVHATEKGRL